LICFNSISIPLKFIIKSLLVNDVAFSLDITSGNIFQVCVYTFFNLNNMFSKKI